MADNTRVSGVVSFTGDDLVPNANMVYDNRSRLIHAPASEVRPWLLQVGKGRGGWYLPSTLERVLPRSWRAARKIEERWQGLSVGDTVPDYGFNAKEDIFEVAVLEESALVFTSERYGTVFTWALLLESAGAQGDADGVVVHLRFRGRIKSTGWKQKAIVAGGHWMDWVTSQPMLAGLAERAEMSWSEKQKKGDPGKQKRL